MIGLNREDSPQDQPVPVAAMTRQLTIDALIKKSRNAVCPGAIPIRYVEQSTGRLFAEGLSLQSAPREVRNAALAGCWDYDISNCHWSLINQLAEQYGHRCTAIRHYLAHKQDVRSEIAAGAGITTQDAKECLLMIMYGAQRSAHEEASIPGQIGPKAARELFQSPAFRQLCADVVKARSIIVKNLPVSRGWVLNALGLQIHRKEKPKALLAHILQGLEAKALMAVVREHGDNVQLCVHDGWVTRERLVVADVEQLIRDAIGLKVEVEEVQLEPIKTPEPALPPSLVDKTVDWHQTQHPCRLPEDLEASRATSSPAGTGLPSPDNEPASTGPGLIVSERPHWNRRPRAARRQAAPNAGAMSGQSQSEPARRFITPALN